MGPRQQPGALHPASVRTVLICRINGRMGNTLMLTPLIRLLHDRLPHASIDLAIAYPKAVDLLSDLPGLRRIIVFPHRTPRMIWRYLAALRRLRACHYDLAIDPVPESTGGRAVLTFCRAAYRLGFSTKHQWAPLTHAVPPPRDSMHQAMHPVFLLSRALGVPYDMKSVRLWLPLREDELSAGRRLIARAVGAQCPQATARVFGFFAHAAGCKAIDRAWWCAFWDQFLALEPDAVPVEYLPSERHAPVDPRFSSFHVASPRVLSAAIAATRMFISSDTGPMHLASSTGVPTVALFLASDPALYRPLKPIDLVIDVAQSSPSAVARRCQGVWRAGDSTSQRAAIAACGAE
jgi:heptosyltransferase-3